MTHIGFSLPWLLSCGHSLCVHTTWWGQFCNPLSQSPTSNTYNSFHKSLDSMIPSDCICIGRHVTMCTTLRCHNLSTFERLKRKLSGTNRVACELWPKLGFGTFSIIHCSFHTCVTLVWKICSSPSQILNFKSFKN